MKKRDKVILSKITDESAVIAKMLNGITESEFLSNDEKMRAVCMTLINIGELVKNLSDDFREEHKAIPWKALAGLRDVTAHGYFTLRMADIWVYATVELPTHTAMIVEILSVVGE